MTTSPWQKALDLTGLDPELERYFAGIPLESEGVGHGIFESVGTPRRWLWPVLALLARDGIVAPVWERDVPFQVRNRARADGSLEAERRFEFPSGDFVMSDRILARGGLLLDRLGRSGRIAASFSSRVVGGALHLRSVEVRARVGGSWLRLPWPFTPQVDLVERYDRDIARQHVDLSLSLPVIGRIYGYSGWFTYSVRPRGESTE